MRRILVTGISGFVGTSLSRFFSTSAGVEILGYSRKPDVAEKKLRRYSVTFLPELTAQEMDKRGIDTIIHLAGIAHDLTGRYRKEDYHRANCVATTALYNEFMKSKAVRFIFVSSIKAVVDNSPEAIFEDVLPSPASDYGKSKRNAEEYIMSQQLSGQKRWYILRPSMIYGEGNKGNLNLLYKLIKMGIPYPLGTFQNERSFLSIDNFNFVINKFIENDFPSGVFNIADSGTISTVELVRTIASSSGKKARILNIPKGWIKLAAAVGSALHLPFNAARLGKLTDNMIVSNVKLLKTIDCDLPLTLRDGLQNTVRSFL